jgi:hypothetical protein
MLQAASAGRRSSTGFDLADVCRPLPLQHRGDSLRRQPRRRKSTRCAAGFEQAGASVRSGASGRPALTCSELQAGRREPGRLGCCAGGAAGPHFAAVMETPKPPRPACHVSLREGMRVDAAVPPFPPPPPSWGVGRGMVQRAIYHGSGGSPHYYRSPPQPPLRRTPRHHGRPGPTPGDASWRRIAGPASAELSGGCTASLRLSARRFLASV